MSEDEWFIPDERPPLEIPESKILYSRQRINRKVIVGFGLVGIAILVFLYLNNPRSITQTQAPAQIPAQPQEQIPSKNNPVVAPPEPGIPHGRILP